ncbi:MAG: YaiO family outer membrane beta-barrel protein [Bacteroidetes bacterium]|nr:YaiO family outer membrane beta-barrel protein [Bacteroidota bacterium]
MRKVSLFSILITIYCFALHAQDIPGYANPEQGFELMRQLAVDGDYGTAKQLGYKLCGEHGNYYDVALYLARIHGWESSFDSAYLVLDEVISKEPELYEAYKTCVDLAYWENNRTRLEDCADKALELEPGSEEILEKLNRAAQQNESQVDKPEVFLHYSYDHFSMPYVRNWHMLTAGGQIPFEYGTLIPYINGGYHAGNNTPSTDLQLNLDVYLTLGKKNYALLGYGFSPNGVLNYLPRHRAAAEIWQALPKGFGLSAGMRYFYWDSHFTFLTFSAEKYAGNYWFSFRNYLFFKELGVSGSYYLTGRRYFASKNDHLTLTLGYGTAPDEPLLVISDLDRLNSASCRIEYSKQLSPLLRMIAGIGYGYEEYMDQTYRNRIDMKLGCYFRIKN